MKRKRVIKKKIITRFIASTKFCIEIGYFLFADDDDASND